MNPRSEKLPRPRLIVNADDFGLTQNINAGIVKAHLEGVVTSTSIMANGRAFDDALALAARHPSLDLGIHLTLVGEAPLCSPERIFTLLGPDERLLPHARSFFLRYLRGGIDKDHLRRELEAQVDRVLEAGLNVTHLDSHQHLHVLPGVLPIVQDLAQKYAVPVVRWPREVLGRDILKESLRRPGRLAELTVLRSLTRKNAGIKMQHPDRFAGFFRGGRLSVSALLSFLPQLEEGTVTELMCHPGLDDPSSPYRHWGYGWADELEALTAPEIRSAIRKRGIDLVSFRDLRGDGPAPQFRESSVS